MTLKKDWKQDGWVITCDKCDDTELLGEDTFLEALAEAKEDHGYRAVKVGDDWEHRCPTCKT